MFAALSLALALAFGAAHSGFGGTPASKAVALGHARAANAARVASPRSSATSGGGIGARLDGGH